MVWLLAFAYVTRRLGRQPQQHSERPGEISALTISPCRRTRLREMVLLCDHADIIPSKGWTDIVAIIINAREAAARDAASPRMANFTGCPATPLSCPHHHRRLAWIARARTRHDLSQSRLYSLNRQLFCLETRPQQSERIRAFGTSCNASRDASIGSEVQLDRDAHLDISPAPGSSGAQDQQLLDIRRIPGCLAAIAELGRILPPPAPM